MQYQPRYTTFGCRIVRPLSLEIRWPPFSASSFCCPDNWAIGTYGCYKQLPGQGNYFESAARCARLDPRADLPTFFSNESQDEIRNHMSIASSIFFNAHYVVDHGGDWKWKIFDKTKKSCDALFMKFHDGHGNITDDYKCAYYSKLDHVTANDKMFQVSCGNLKLPILCQITLTEDYCNSNDSRCYDDQNDCFHKENPACTIGMKYEGSKSKTRNGILCQDWSKDKPHNSDYKAIDGNTCGDPEDGDYAWCYTTDQNQERQYCYKDCTAPAVPTYCSGAPVTIAPTETNPIVLNATNRLKSAGLVKNNLGVKLGVSIAFILIVLIIIALVFGASAYRRRKNTRAEAMKRTGVMSKTSKMAKSGSVFTKKNMKFSSGSEITCKMKSGRQDSSYKMDSPLLETCRMKSPRLKSYKMKNPQQYSGKVKSPLLDSCKLSVLEKTCELKTNKIISSKSSKTLNGVSSIKTLEKSTQPDLLLLSKRSDTDIYYETIKLVKKK